MNKNRLKGYHRDKAIIEEIEKRGVLNTEQIYELFFKHLSQGMTIAQRRLKRLTELKHIKRNRLTVDQPYYYYVDKKLKQLEHRIISNWVYVKLKKDLKDWEQLFHFEYEQNYGLLRADAFAGVINSITKKYTFYFVEADISNNTFDKIAKYNTLFET